MKGHSDQDKRDDYRMANMTQKWYDAGNQNLTASLASPIEMRAVYHNGTGLYQNSRTAELHFNTAGFIFYTQLFHR